MIRNDNILIQATRHEIWGWPAVVNLLMGSTAAGYYLFSLLNIELCQQIKAVFPLFRYNFITPILVATGLITVGIEAGSPLRGIFLLHHLRRSWMSREVLTGFAFIAFALLDWIQPLVIYKLLGAITAIGFLTCQGQMVSRACAVTAWNNHLVTAYYMASGLSTGFGFLLLWSSIFAQSTISALIYVCGLICLVSTFIIWLCVIKPKSDPWENKSLIHLRNPFSMRLTIGVGLVMPILLSLAIVVLTAFGFVSGNNIFLPLMTGFCVLIGGAVQKTAFLLQANSLRPIAAGQPIYHDPPCHRS